MSSHLDMPAIAVALGVVLPLVTGFITKAKAPSWVKSVVNALLSSIAGALIVVVHNGGHVNVGQVVVGVAETWGASIVAHAGFWAPTGTAAKVQNIAAEFGFGKTQSTEVVHLLARLIPSAKPVIATVTADVAAEKAVMATETDPSRVNTPTAADTSAAVSEALSASPASPVEAVAADLVAAAPALVADPSPAAVEAVAAEVAAPAAAAALEAVHAPPTIAAVVNAVAADAPVVVGEVKVDSHIAALHAARDAIDAALVALA